MNEKKRKNILKSVLLGLLLGVLVGGVGTVTYAFFNYTNVGVNNLAQAGSISFRSVETDTINLTNAYPITREVAIADNDNTNSTDDLVISVIGDTNYSGGIEYLITATAVTNTVGNKTVPISIIATASNLGTEDEDYFDNRGPSANSSIYKVLANETILANDDQLLVGYIKSGVTGVNGTLRIRAYLDTNNIIISDTYTLTESDISEGKVVLTTTEWNSIKGNYALSFKVNVEAREGIWVRNPNATATFDTGPVVHTKLSKIPFNSQYNGTTNINDMIDYNFIRVYQKPDISQFTTKNILSSNNSETEIYAWFDSSDYSIKWYTETEKIYLNQDSSYMFANSYITDYTFLTFFDTSRVINMSHMFDNAYNMFSTSKFALIENWNVSSVTDMSYMFENCLTESPIGTSLISLNNWDIRNVSDFTGMFRYYQTDRDDLVSGSSFNDLIFPTFSLRPGTWDNQIIDNDLKQHSGTYVPSE